MTGENNPGSPLPVTDGVWDIEAMIDAALPHVYAVKSPVRPIGQFWPGETADESEWHNQTAYGRDRVREALRAALSLRTAPPATTEGGKP